MSNQKFVEGLAKILDQYVIRDPFRTTDKKLILIRLSREIEMLLERLYRESQVPESNPNQLSLF